MLQQNDSGWNYDFVSSIVKPLFLLGVGGVKFSFDGRRNRRHRINLIGRNYFL